MCSAHVPKINHCLEKCYGNVLILRSLNLLLERVVSTLKLLFLVVVVVPMIETKCFKKDCIYSLSQPQKNKSSIKLLWCISQSIIFQDILASFVLSQPRLLCQVVVRICREISKCSCSVPDTNISHLLISVIILIPKITAS